ncbi:hypothetical protein EJ02DRAFT_496833 [Clathrospora elynae]|uniref:Uncharacterized protein n=1 Tax=Clathrospora elynae TaxID=706981 RepID=A0A6A5SG31_9PLEO|nr:hypothetical protein EJ02DRAFT_496833 [Clathrospora elynae]
MSNLGVPAEISVYTGAWTNWTHGSTLGATLTLSKQNSSFLIAFIALFIAFAGGSLFRIYCFLAHILWSSPSHKDTIHHQRQATLRNSTTGFSAIISLTQLLWSWKSKDNGAVRRLLPLLAIMSLLTIASIAAGILSPEISAFAGDEVLVSSPYCGVPNFNPLDMPFGTFLVYQSHITKRMHAFRNYAQDCYTVKSSPSCKTMARSTLARTVDTNASCPFDPKLCKTANNNIRIDTGLLDSHHDIGFNAPPNMRAQMRFVYQCAPLVTEGFNRNFTGNVKNMSIPYRSYFYGPSKGQSSEAGANQTYMHPDIAAQRYRLEVLGNENPGYKTLTTFDPIPELKRNDSDVYLIFLSANNIIFTDEINDPWYSAHKKLVKLRWNNDSDATQVQMYISDGPASPLACAVQGQTCVMGNNGKQECSTLSSLAAENPTLKLNKQQKNVVDWTSAAAFGIYGMVGPIQNLGANVLTSIYSVNNGIQGTLEPNQWQTDVERMADIMLAAIQGAAVDTATGPADPEMRQFYTKPSTQEGDYFCRNQKIRSTAYASFSILGLAIMFSVGSLIVLTHWSLEPLYSHWLSRYCRSRRYCTVEWKQNYVLQLQRLAHEGIGAGSWKGCDTDYPWTEWNEQLATLNIEDLTHPRLRAKEGEEVQEV